MNSASKHLAPTDPPRRQYRDDPKLQAINARLESLLERGIFASADPYILTIPQDEAARYRHRSRHQQYQFVDNTPFSTDEWENIQYQTYRYHDPAHSIFSQAVHDYSGERPRKHISTPRVETPSTAPKKVISFGAYKKQKVETAPTDVAEEPKREQPSAINEPLARIKAESEQIMADAEEAEKETAHSMSSEVLKGKINGDNSLEKSSRDASTIGPSGSSITQHDKKRRQDSVNEDIEREQERAAVKAELSPLSGGTKSVSDIPPKLSPLRETLPARLSPTLPDSIMSSLQNRKRDKGTPGTPANDAKKHISPAPKNGFRAGSRSPEPAIRPRGTQGGGEKGRSLVVKLTIDDPEARRRFRSLADDRYEKKEPKKPKVEAKGMAQKIGPAKSEIRKKEPAKRAHDGSDDEPVAKKAKHDDRPVTPIGGEVPSPVSTKQGLLATPSRKDIHEANMRRSHSKEGIVSTPSNEVSTPLVNGHAATVSTSTPTSQSMSKTAEQRAWETEQKRLNDLGRTLKHEAEAHVKATHPELELAAIKSVESFLAFVLAFTCADEAALTADPKQRPTLANWRSLVTFSKFVRRNCSKLPILSGLAAMLSVSFSSHVLELIEQLPQQDSLSISRNMFVEMSALLRSSSRDAVALLGLDELQKLPKSWKKSTKGELKVERLDRDKLLGGQYQLPLNMATTPVHAARAVFEILQEWMDMHGGAHKFKYKLQLHA